MRKAHETIREASFAAALLAARAVVMAEDLTAAPVRVDAKWLVLSLLPLGVLTLGLNIVRPAKKTLLLTVVLSSAIALTLAISFPRSGFADRSMFGWPPAFLVLGLLGHLIRGLIEWIRRGFQAGGEDGGGE